MNDGLLTAISDTKDDSIYRFKITGTEAHRIGATPLRLCRFPGERCEAA